jgi:hypothetical protein
MLPVSDSASEEPEAPRPRSTLSWVFIAALALFVLSAGSFAVYFFVFRIVTVNEPTPIKSASSATVKPVTLKSFHQPTFVQVLMTDPVLAVKMAFTKYTPISVTSVVGLVCLLALVASLGVVYGQPSQNSLTDSKSTDQPGASTVVATNNDGFTWKGFLAGLFTKYLGWSITAIAVACRVDRGNRVWQLQVSQLPHFYFSHT